MRVKHKIIIKNKVIKIIIFLTILILISSLYIIKIFNERAMPQFISYSKIETKKITTLIINSSVQKEIADNIKMEDLFFTSYDNSGNIISIDLNSKFSNELLSKISKSVEQNLIYVENGRIDKLDNEIISNYNKNKLKKGIIYELPSGIIFNNIVLNNIFPKIPIKISPTGSIMCKLVTDIQNYGINNALIKVSINITVDISILMPFTTSITTVEVSLPIIMKVLQGSVPGYYLNGYMETPIVTNNVK